MTMLAQRHLDNGQLNNDNGKGVVVALRLRAPLHHDSPIDRRLMFYSPDNPRIAALKRNKDIRKIHTMSENKSPKKKIRTKLYERDDLSELKRDLFSHGRPPKNFSNPEEEKPQRLDEIKPPFRAFNKVFDESASNGQVYDNIARGIVKDVTVGLNGTILAYGPESSGKTYTIHGNGSFLGLTQLAIRDIFSQIGNDSDRIYSVRVSCVEIYNEFVKDLLMTGDRREYSSAKNLTLVKSPERSLSVKAQEEVAKSAEELLRIVSIGEKNRTVTHTKTNKRSSRSHAITQIIIESSKKTLGGDTEKEDFENDGCYHNCGEHVFTPVRKSTLTLVDLAAPGAENAHFVDTFGGDHHHKIKINQSLFALSQVIRGLSAPENKHGNFRDSKLTRVLQSRLTGDDHIAIICCSVPPSPSTNKSDPNNETRNRSTAKFASRARSNIKCQPQVNEKVDEQNCISNLQRKFVMESEQLIGSFEKYHQDSKSCLDEDSLLLDDEPDFDFDLASPLYAKLAERCMS